MTSAGGESCISSLCRPMPVLYLCTRIVHLEVTVGLLSFQGFSFFNFSSRIFTITNFFILLILFTLILKHFYLLVSSFPVPFGFSPFLCISTSFSVFPLTLEIPKGSLLFDHCVSILLSHFCHYHYPSPTLHHPPRKNQFSPPWVQ